MSIENTTSVETTPVAAPNTSGKKTAAQRMKANNTPSKPKKEAKKPAAKKPAKNAEPTANKMDADKLRKPQGRILVALAKAKAPLTRAKLADASGIDQAWVGDWIGYLDADKRSAQEAKIGYTSLITFGYVKVKEVTVDDRATNAYEITATGRKAAEKFAAEQKEKEAAKKEKGKKKAK